MPIEYEVFALPSCTEASRGAFLELKGSQDSFDVCSLRNGSREDSCSACAESKRPQCRNGDDKAVAMLICVTRTDLISQAMTR